MSVLDRLDWITYILGTPLEATLGVLCFLRARAQRSGVLSFYLLGGFYTCLCLCNAYYLLSWTVADYPRVFSPGDLSWVGGLLFLITTAQTLIRQWTPEQRVLAGEYRRLALVAPIICLAFNIVFIALYPEIVFNYALYGIPTLILSYYTLWLWLATRKDATRSDARAYHLTVLIWLAIQLFYDLFSTLGDELKYAIPFTVCSWLLMLASGSIYFAARRGVAA